MLSVRGLTKNFPATGGGASKALDSIAFSAQAGGLVCVLGPNGSGKTTLLKILAGLVLPDAGGAEIAGCDLLCDPLGARRKVGFSPGGGHSFYGRLDALENLVFFGRLRGLRRRQVEERLKALEETLDLGQAPPLPVQRASAGFRERLSLARALLHDPAVLLLDEPTRSLDPGAASRVREFIRKDFLTRAGRLVLWSTHDVREAWAIATELLILDGGRLAARGTPERLLRHAQASGPEDAYRFWTRRGGV